MKLALAQFADGAWHAPLPTDLDSERTLVLAFGASEYLDHPRPLEEIVAAFPRSRVVGCSTSGEILGSKIADDTVVCAVLRFEGGEISSASSPVALAADSFAVGASLGSRLAAPSLRAVLVLSDGLCVNGTELVRGLNSTLPEAVVVTGGLAGDGDRMQRTWVFADGVARSGAVVAVGLHGAGIRVAHGSKGGWDIFGVERVVTRSEGNVLYELDGRPALELYKKYLGERAAGLPATALLFPLALRAATGDEPVVRTVLGVSEADQSMTFAGDVPVGAHVQLMRANFDRLIQGAADAALSMGARMDGGDTLCLAISCVGRRLVLRQRAEEEVEAVRLAMEGVSGQIGFYSYGELSPHASGRCRLHNQTMTLTTLGEIA